MLSPNFPLLRAAGLRVEYTDAHLAPPTAVVRAADVERLLEQAPVVRNAERMKDEWSIQSHPEDTHTARLVLVTPIVRDTAESLLRELMDIFNKAGHDGYAVELLERARKLLTEAGAR